MKPIRQNRVVPLVSAIVLLISPALAGRQPHAQLAMTQGSRYPGSLVATTEQHSDKHRRRVEVTFTKWITTYPLMAGFTGGDADGVFAGEVFQRQVSLNGHVIRLEAMYEVQAGNRSFTALIRGGTSGATGAALLDGVILAGWRTGARVQVEFQTMTNCAGAPVGTCFQGTIRVMPDSED